MSSVRGEQTRRKRRVRAGREPSSAKAGARLEEPEKGGERERPVRASDPREWASSRQGKDVLVG